MSNFNENAFEAALELVAATLEGEADVSINTEGAQKVIEYFKGIYGGMCEMIGDEKFDDECCCEQEDAEEEESPEAEETKGEETEKDEEPKADEVIFEEIAENAEPAEPEVTDTVETETEESTAEIVELPAEAEDTVVEELQPEKLVEPAVELVQEHRIGKFVIKHTQAGYSFTLKAANGEIIAASEVYATREACIGGINSIKTSAMGQIEDRSVENYIEYANPKFELYIDKTGEYRFRLKAANGSIIAASEGYTRKESCLKGIESIRRNVTEAEIVEQIL